MDGLRFFAIAAVVVWHIGQIIGEAPYVHKTAFDRDVVFRILHIGTIGVPLFFVISGFVLSLPFAEHYLKGKPKPRIGKYFLRRVTRLEPPYILNLLLIFILLNRHDIFNVNSLKHLLASMFYMHNAVYQAQSTVNFVAWSLEIEVQFYIIAPLLARMFIIRDTMLRRSTIAGAALLIVIIQSVAHLPPFYAGLTLASQLQFFLMGFLLVDVYLVTWKQKPVHRFGWDIISIICSCLLALVLFYNIGINLISPILILVMYFGAFQGRLVSAIVRNRWIVVIGGMCYTTYLYHVILIGRFHYKLTSHLYLTHSYTINTLLQVVLLSPIIIICSVLMFAFFEKPFMQRDWPRKWWSLLRRRKCKLPAV